jgi:hypothetical protein
MLLLTLVMTKSWAFVEFRGTWGDDVALSLHSYFGTGVTIQTPISAISFPSSGPNMTFFTATVYFRDRSYTAPQGCLDYDALQLPDGGVWLFRVSPPLAWFQRNPPQSFPPPGFHQRVLSVLNDTQLLNGTDVHRFSRIRARLLPFLDSSPLIFTSLGFDLFPDTVTGRPFSGGLAIKGSVTIAGNVFPLNGYLFDHLAYSIESKVCGVWCAFSLLCSFLAWRSVYRRAVHLRMRSHPLPLAASIWHASVDFAIAYALVAKLPEALNIAALFFFVGGFWVPVTMLAAVPIGLANPEFNERDPRARLCLVFVATVITLPTMVAALCVFESPVYCSIVLFSPFLLQICSNAWVGGRRRWGDWFVVSLAASRLLLLWYFCFRDPAAKGAASAKMGIVFSLYLIGQVVILLLQHHYGGRFFWPRRVARTGYRYLRLAESEDQCPICLVGIARGEEIMATPCGHLYHRGCLARWMRRSLTCPLCRAALPLPSPSDFETRQAVP